MKSNKNPKEKFVPKLNPKQGWKQFKVCSVCMALVKNGQTCSECGTRWENQ